MKKRMPFPILLIILFLTIFSLSLNSCIGKKDVLTGDQAINPSDFTTNINNPYFTLTPGTTFIYEGSTGEGTEHNEVAVTNDTRSILGVDTIIVWDRVWLEGDLIEETYDWYAQDKEGNVWYFGEDSKEYENGIVISTKGSWETGVDGAKPGIIMEVNPKIGDSYQEEYYQGEAEDMADIVSLEETVKVTYGTFENCLKTKNWTPLEPDVLEYKYYSTETGAVVLETLAGGNGRIELIDIVNN